MRETGAPPSRDERFGESHRVSDEPASEPTRAPALFASSIEEPRSRSGLSIWFAAAAALVVGIVLGFASGYRTAKGPSTIPAGAIENPAPTSGAGQPFSESPVSDPVKLEPEPIVPAPATVPAGPPRATKPATEPTPQKPVRPAAEPPPAKTAIPAVAEATASGPGSLQVVSRPAGAQVVMDGRSIGRTPMTIADVPVGEHSIRLELPGFKRWVTTADVKAGSATRVAASLEQ